MKDRTCILVTHHVRLCLPVAAMLVRMDGGRAELEEINESDLKDLPDIAEADEKTVTAEPSSKAQTTGAQTPINGGLITKEHRDIVRHLAVFACSICLIQIHRAPSNGRSIRCICKPRVSRLGWESCRCCWRPAV